MSAEKSKDKNSNKTVPKAKLKLVMVVEDENALANMLCQMIQYSGFAFELAKDGEEALDKIGKNKPDAIVLDIVMPKIDGWEVCRRVKADRGTEKVPVVIYSSLSDTKDFEKGKSVGADQFIPKDQNVLKVLEAVKTLLSSKK